MLLSSTFFVCMEVQKQFVENLLPVEANTKEGISKSFPHVNLIWLLMSKQNYHSTGQSVEVSDNALYGQ